MLQRDFRIVDVLATSRVLFGFPLRKEGLEVAGVDAVDRDDFDAFVNGENLRDEAVLLEDSGIEMMVRGELLLFEDIDGF